jgi:hypothetical protein
VLSAKNLNHAPSENQKHWQVEQRKGHWLHHEVRRYARH